MFLLQGQTIIRADHLAQIFLPQSNRCFLVRIGHVGRQLFTVSGIEIREHPADQSCRLPADIALFIKKKLIQET